MKLLEELQDKNSVTIPLVLALATVLTRIPFTSKMLYHMDSIQFALALEKFDVTVHQPHPPGYFLYIMLGRLFNFFIHDPNSSYIAISILFSALTVVVVYYLGIELFGSKCALLAALFAITSPSLWFHGEVALSYAVESFFSALIGLLCWKIYTGEKGHIWLLAIVMAIAGGIRQNTPVFLVPLCLFSVSKLPLRKILASVCLFAGASLLWFVPMAQMTGGFEVYIAALRHLWHSTAENKSVFDQGWSAFYFHSFILYNFVVYIIGVGIVILIFRLYYTIRNRKLNALDYNKVVFFSLWVLPSFLFFLFIAIHPAVPGHVLIILPPLLLMTAEATSYICSEIKGLINFNPLGAVTFIVILTNLYIFFCLQYGVSYPTIKEHDRSLSLVVNRFKALDPDTTVIFLYMKRIYYGLNHATYYLPQFAVYDPKVIPRPLADDKKIWSGFNGRTILTDKIVLPGKIKSFATLLYSDDMKQMPEKGPITIEQLTPDIYMVSGPLAYAAEVYPELSLQCKIAK